MPDAILAADLFCGAGGTSTGLFNAARALGREVRLLAINHWRVAVETHRRNHPLARHLATGLEAVTPADVVPGGRLDLLWASPSCTHHSVARSGKPRSNQLRAQPQLILDWLDQLYVRRLIIENVPEFTSWGPLGADGMPLKSKRGVLFDDYLRSLAARGYKTDWRILCCADYGDPTTRRRFFLQAVRGRERICWPDPTHAEHPGGLFADSRRWVPAREIIDWTIPGQSIFRRKKPLSPNTLRRIEAGIRKFWDAWAQPFFVLLRGTRDGTLERTCFDLDQPLPTVTAGGGHVGLVEPFLAVSNNWPHQQAGYPLDRPLPTQTGANHVAVVEPFILPQHSCGAGSGMDQPIATLTSTGASALVEPFMVSVNNGANGENTSSRVRALSAPIGTQTGSNTFGILEPFLVSFYGNGQALSVREPFATVTCKDRFGVVQQYGLDILFRMLQPHELARAHSFPPDYVFGGSKSDIIKQIGNSVPVRTAQALCEAALSA